MKILIAILATLTSISAQAEEAPLEPPYTRSSSSSQQLEKVPVPKPNKVDDEGTYFYGTEKTSDKYYNLEAFPDIKSAYFLRFGTIGPFDIVADNGKTYEDIYSDKASFVVGFEYERLLGSLAGKWSWKFNTGITTEDGQGAFENPSNFVPEEKYTFYVFPNTVTVSYKMRFSDNQWFTPYLDGGAGYFTFIEYRDDGHGTAIGGAPVLTGAGGLLISLSAIDQVAKAAMFEDYGVKHLWLDLQFRRIEGLDDKKNFSSNMVSAGFGFAY